VTAEPQDNSDLPEHDVAVVVFARVRAVDYRDAANIAERAVAQGFRQAQVARGGEPGQIVFGDPYRNFCVPARIAEIRELGIACGDSHLRVTPSGKAFRQLNEQREREEDGSDEQTT
jgi:hypothetical protein